MVKEVQLVPEVSGVKEGEGVVKAFLDLKETLDNLDHQVLLVNLVWMDLKV